MYVLIQIKNNSQTLRKKMFYDLASAINICAYFFNKKNTYLNCYLFLVLLSFSFLLQQLKYFIQLNMFKFYF